MAWLGAGGVLFGSAVAACGSDGTGDPGTTPPPGGTDSGIDGPDPFGNGSAKLTGVTVDPPTATIEILNDLILTENFTAVGHFSDGSSKAISADSWTASRPNIGGVDAKGTYTPSAAAGGAVTITASYQGNKGTATLNVKLHYTQNPANVGATDQAKLKAASTVDGTIVWAYPYDKTVFPRGLNSTPLEWNNGKPADEYFVHLVSPFYELETFVTAPAPSRFSLPNADWTKFVDSTSGAADLFVNRFDGVNATTVVHHTWTIAPASMRGTIYYWANNLGRVMRIKPGATSPDDFANLPPLNDPAKYPKSECLMTCHTVSADGSVLVSGGGTYGGSYDLKNSKPMYSLGGVWGNGQTNWQVVQWMMPALSPTGKYMLTNSMAAGLSAAVGGPGSFLSLYDTSTGNKVPNSGLDGAQLAMPAWSPDGSRIAYVDSGPYNTWGGGWTNPNAGDLKVLSFDEKQNPMAYGATTIQKTNGAPTNRILWPTRSPDGQWIVYTRGASGDTRYTNADLFIASATTANSEVRLAGANGDGYPFAAGVRDKSWNFEPAFAPVAAGGYFWFVMTSRRTYGNELLGSKDAVKQLWVVAIDQAPTMGKDPSHPAFRLPGQAIDSINMRGFWALDPCKPDGSPCSTGTECCGGFCDPAPDGGGAVCGQKQGCSNNGDKCDVSNDCCNASAGVTCINHVCSEPTPN